MSVRALRSSLASIVLSVVVGGCGERAPAVTPADGPPPPEPIQAAREDTPKAEPGPVSKEPPEGFQLERDTLVVPSPIAYATGGAELTGSDAALAHVKAFLDARADVTLLRIEVHTDKVGSPEALQALSDKRALAVGRALVAKGVDCKRLVPVGFGAEKPVADEATAEGRAKNRRTSFVVAMLRGRAIGGLPSDGGGHVSGDLCL